MVPLLILSLRTGFPAVSLHLLESSLWIWIEGALGYTTFFKGAFHGIFSPTMAHAASQLKKNRDFEINAEEEAKEKRRHRKRSRDRKKKVSFLPMTSGMLCVYFTGAQPGLGCSETLDHISLVPTAAVMVQGVFVLCTRQSSSWDIQFCSQFSG